MAPTDNETLNERIEIERQQIEESNLSREEKRRQFALLDKKKQSLRYDPSVIVVVEFIAPEREQRTGPLKWRVGEELFGFWSQPRPSRVVRGRIYSLKPWQEALPASIALPKVDFEPERWKLIHDPRESADATADPATADAAPTVPPPAEDPVIAADATRYARIMTFLSQLPDVPLSNDDVEGFHNFSDEDLLTSMDEFEKALFKKDGTLRAKIEEKNVAALRAMYAEYLTSRAGNTASGESATGAENTADGELPDDFNDNSDDLAG